MVKRKNYSEPVDPPTFTALTLEHLEWLDQNFDVFQETYHRKWGELAKQMRKVFAIPEKVDGITVRNKLLSYWVRFGKPSRVINYSRSKYARTPGAPPPTITAPPGTAAALLPPNTTGAYNYIEYNINPADGTAFAEGKEDKESEDEKDGEEKEKDEEGKEKGEGKEGEEKEAGKDGEKEKGEGKEGETTTTTTTTTSVDGTPQPPLSPNSQQFAAGNADPSQFPFNLTYQAAQFGLSNGKKPGEATPETTPTRKTKRSRPSSPSQVFGQAGSPSPRSQQFQIPTTPTSPSQQSHSPPSTPQQASPTRLPPIVKIHERRNPTARRKEYLVERQGCAPRWENQSTAQSNAADRRNVLGFDLWWEQRSAQPPTAAQVVPQPPPLPTIPLAPEQPPVV